MSFRILTSNLNSLALFALFENDNYRNFMNKMTILLS